MRIPPVPIRVDPQVPSELCASENSWCSVFIQALKMKRSVSSTKQTPIVSRIHLVIVVESLVPCPLLL